MASPSEVEPRSAEKAESKGPELKASKAEVKRAGKIEREKAEADLARKGIEAKETIETEEKKAEKKQVMAKERGGAEKEKPAATKPVRRARPKPHTQSERDKVFDDEIKQVQAQLSPTTRAFSKVIHNKTVEKVSDGAQKTILRPSAMIGGAVLGLLLGLVAYIIARVYHYSLGSFEIIAIFVVGAIVGLLVELITKRVKS